MKYLNDYTDPLTTILFKKHKAFFAFNNEQFAEQKQVNEIHVHMGAGLYCPKATYKELSEELDSIYEKCIKQDIEDHAIEAIIKRELNNHEAYWSGDISSTVDALAGYDITEEQIYKVFRNQNIVLNKSEAE